MGSTVNQKPRLKRAGIGWSCKGCGAYGWAITQEMAFAEWQRGRRNVRSGIIRGAGEAP